MLSSVIFDFDGVIVNTEPLHYRAMQEVLSPAGLGYTWEEYVAIYIGFDDRDAIRERVRRAGRTLSEIELENLGLRKADAFERLVVAEGADPYPGVVGLIKALAGRIPVGLCSGALRRDVDPILAGLGVSRSFDAIVTTDDVKTSKPDPECYRMVVEQLGSRAASSIAIEDTPAGISAAKGAGLKVLAVPNSYERIKLNGADFFLKSLEDVTLASLQGMLA